jgi:penicillin-binding protein 1C
VFARYGKLKPALLTFILSGAGLSFLFCLPDPLFNEPVSAVILSRDMRLLGARIADDEQWRFPEIQQVPEKFKTALLEFEDKRFYIHPGFDPLAFARALYLNIKHHRIVSGGSTVSMQVIRLARKNRPRTITEKLIEIVLVLRLELRYSKKEILALYASHAPFGGNVVGLEAAAWRYFGRAPNRLSWSEYCLLAVLPNSPALINPGRDRNILLSKRNLLLRRLHAAGEINDMELLSAEAEPLPEKPLVLPRQAPHLLQTLLAQSRQDEYRFLTTLDDALQRAALDIVRQHAQSLQPKGVHNVSAIVVDNDTSEVLAYIGNSYPEVSVDRGYAVDIIQSRRSSGSTLKPFLFAAMLQSGDILPTTLIPDVPSQYAGYMPENYDRRYRGAVPAQEALARSLNVPAVYMLQHYGVDRFYDFLQQLGMSTLFRQPSEYGLTLILGGAETTLWEVTSMYSNLAVLAKSERMVKQVAYRKLKILQGESVDSDRESEISTASAWMTLNALLEVNRPGEEGYWKNFSSTKKIAWKTGTSFGLRDAWSIGVNGKYTVGVWAGNASGEGRPELTGTTAAAPAMFDIFNYLNSGEWFNKPLGDMKQVEICENDGYLANGHCQSKPIWIGLESHFEKVSPHNRLVHLDAGGRRVHSLCEDIFKMRRENWFHLPPAQEHYYRRRHSDYKPVPKFRNDCIDAVAGFSRHSEIELLYPNRDTKFYIPVDLGSVKEHVIFEAVHRDPDARLFWHLDQQYLGETKYFHQQALDVEVGIHQLVLVDEKGDRLVRKFEVLGTDEKKKM